MARYEMGNGKLTKLREYTNGVRNGASITVHINGPITSDETYLNDQPKRPAGQDEQLRQVKLIENYKDGIFRSLRKMFYDNAQVQEEGIYKNGQRMV